MPAAFARTLGSAARVPALHFLVIGAALAAIHLLATEPATKAIRPPIVITAARVAEIRDDYEATLSRPTDEELKALVARAADEEMLYREALMLGLDRGDAAVKWRVIEKMHFLYGEDIDNEDAYRRGVALGLAKDDSVVRNALVTKMRLMTRAASRSEEPTGDALDRELGAYLVAHADLYRRRDERTVTQIFLSAGTRGPALEADARTLLQRLRTEHTTPEAATRLGDPFIAGSTFRAIAEPGLAKMFGDDFATAVAALPADQWSEPIRSPYGLHLVWVSGHTAADLPPLEAVRPRVLRAYRAERRDQYLARMMEQLRAAYSVRVETDDHAG